MDPQWLKEAIETHEETLIASRFGLGAEGKASAIAEIYTLIGDRRSPATAERMKRLIGALAKGTKTN